MLNRKKLYEKRNENFSNTVTSISMFFVRYRILLIVSLAIIIFALLTSFIVLQRNTIDVYEDGKLLQTFSTFNDRQDELVKEANVLLGEEDVTTVEWNGRRASLTIVRAIDIYVKADGGVQKVKTQPCSVSDVLQKAGISVADGDLVSHEMDDVVSAGTEIVVTRVTTETYSKTFTISYKTEQVKTNDLYQGETKVKQTGKKGSKTVTYKVTQIDGKESEPEVILEQITKEPQNKIVLVGTKKRPTEVTVSSAVSSKAPTEYKKIISMKATAYTFGDDGGNVTCTGAVPHRGIVAVDTSVIPLGTKLYIASADGSYVYGYAVAGDVGGSIKGNRIDLFMESEREVRNFGRRSVVVYVL